MKRIRFICAVLLIFLLSASLPLCTAASDGVKSEIPYADIRDAATTQYWYRTMKIYTEAEAESAGVPEGFNGYVMMIKEDSASGITVDFSAQSIPVRIIKALHMRVYYNKNTKEVRVTTDAGKSWVLRHAANKPEQWEDVVISDQESLKKLADSDGKLSVFGFGFRYYDGTANNTAYIDEIRAELEEGDSVPPEIRYDGPEHITTTEGKPFVLPVTAWDEGEKAEFDVEYIWDNEATDGNGQLKEGEYALTLRATDSYGNTSEKKLTVSVGKKDTEAPVIGFTVSSIKTVAGAYARLDIKATDNCDETEVLQTWSDGALDKKGRIVEGTHTLTLTASDLTGNVSVQIITVTAERSLG